MKRIINESEFNRNFASNIRFLRESYELTQWQVAKILGYERSAYSYIELGKTSAKIYVAYQLSRIFQVPLTPLLTCHYLDWKNIFPIYFSSSSPSSSEYKTSRTADSSASISANTFTAFALLE